MRQLSSKAPRRCPLLRVYGTYILLNGAAIALMEITRQRPFVQFWTEDGNIWICATDSPAGYHVSMRHFSGRICDTSLARLLAHCLSGTGTYRICSECSREMRITAIGETKTMYEIFKRKYQEQ